MTKAIDLKIGERKLGNGLCLLAVQNPGVQTWACGVMLDVDMKDELPGEEGLASLVGECLDEGTKQRDNHELAAAIEGLGGALEGSASGGGVQVPAECSQKALALLREMLVEPAFPARELARVKAEVLTELRAEDDEPRAVASREFRKLAYGPHPYGRPPRGSRQSVTSFTRADLVRFHRQWFVPHGGYVAAAGPASVGHMLDELERAFRGLKGSPPQHLPVTPPPLPARRTAMHLPMPREQVHVFLGHAGIKRTHPDYYALSVMDHILGTGPGFTSRISRKLRDEQGLCYSVSASITSSAGEEPGVFAAYIGTSPQHRQRAIDGFLAEIETIRTTLPTQDEVRDVQDYLTGSFVFGLERNTNLARYAVRTKRFDLGFDYLKRFPDLIRSVTREDVRRVAQTHLHPDRVVIVSAGAG